MFVPVGTLKSKFLFGIQYIAKIHSSTLLFCNFANSVLYYHILHDIF